MDYHQRLAALCAAPPSRSFAPSGARLLFRRPPLRAYARALTMLALSGLFLVWSFLGAADPTLVEYATILASIGLSAWFLRLALRGDVVAVLDRAGLRLGPASVPWPALISARVSEDGVLIVSFDAAAQATTLEVQPRGVPLEPLAEAIEFVALGPLPAPAD